jgi:hypothetical protein
VERLRSGLKHGEEPFITKSKDIYATNTEKFPHFEQVFRKMSSLAQIQTYYNAEMLNIEEILSILEIHENLGTSSIRNEYIKYIVDVIKYYTPEISPPADKDKADCFNKLLGGRWSKYSQFILSLHNAEVTIQGRLISLKHRQDPSTLYGVISLNYDLVLESVCDYVSDNFFESSLKFHTDGPTSLAPFSTEGVYLAKLHGSINKPETIIPPTWRKTINNAIEKQWKIAFNLLSEANHIRILGYSLPISDSYIKYLLKSAVSYEQNLKSFDVITLDSDGKTKSRYEEFVCFDQFRFVNTRIETYLPNKNVFEKDRIIQNMERFIFTQLESLHREFMNSDSH